MKKLIKKFMELEGQYLIDTARELKEEHPDTEIRICTYAKQGHYNSQTYYYYNAITEEVKEGAGFVSGNSSHYSYKEIGDIEISITYKPGNENYDYIKIERVIHPEDEDMNYADEWTEKQFKIDKEIQYQLQEFRSEHPGSVITTCINCGEQYIVNQEDVENGLYTELADLQYSSGSECICSKCTDNMTVEEFLDTIEDEEKREDYREYMIDWIGMGIDWKLFA